MDKAVWRCRASAIASSSINEACSIVSAPARIASRIERAPCACADTLRPCAWATCTTAAISSGVISGSPGTPPYASTAPDAITLMRSAPPATASSALFRKASGPRATPIRTCSRDLRLGVTGYDQVPAAAGHGQVEPRCLDARADGAAAVDRVAQVPVGPGDVSADIARGGEARQQRHACVLERDRRLVLAAAPVVHAQVRGIAGSIREVRVHVDQARQARQGPQVEHRKVRPGRPAALQCLDPSVAHDHRRRPGRRLRETVDHGTTLDCERPAVGPMWCACDNRGGRGRTLRGTNAESNRQEQLRQDVSPCRPAHDAWTQHLLTLTARESFIARGRRQRRFGATSG